MTDWLNKTHVGDCRELLVAMAADCVKVQTCVTSPPYYGLRSYGGGAAEIGLESTPAEYVAKLVEVFRAVREVLADDGTLWLILGDSYAAYWGDHYAHRPFGADRSPDESTPPCKPSLNFKQIGIKPKDLFGIPWAVALALRDDGWVLRSEIIWEKRNPMPESVTDRPTKGHETIFLFAKAKWSGPRPGRFAHISDADARWLALLIDAEGCIVVKRCKHEGRSDIFAPQVGIGNTSEALMREVTRIVGHGRLLERPGKNCRVLYWQLAHGIATEFLQRIYPFLIVKQRQARICIYVDSLTYYRGGQKAERKRRNPDELKVLDSLWSRNKLCNRFGTPDLSDVPEPVFGRWSECERYYYDAASIAEPGVDPERQRSDRIGGANGHTVRHSPGAIMGASATRNKRTVWTVATQPFAGAHFATFPPELISPCILAGSRPGDTVLDPFHGSGTVGSVALGFGRNYIGCELNPAYAQMGCTLRSTQMGMPL